MVFQNEILTSSLIGIIIGIGVLTILQKYPGEPFSYDINEEEENERKQKNKKKNIKKEKTDEDNYDDNKLEENKEEKEYSVNEVLENITEESILQKTVRFRKTFGIKEEVVREAVRKTKEESKSGIQVDDGISLIKAADWVIFFIVICCGLYILDIVTNGQVYGVLYGLFPNEFETLNLHRPN